MVALFGKNGLLATIIAGITATGLLTEANL